MESLRSFLNRLPVCDQDKFARRCGTTIGYMRKAISAKQAMSAAVCAQAEIVSSGAVRRWDLRPVDWHRVWPELIGHPDAPAVPTGVVNG